MRIELDNNDGYTLDQQAAIDELLEQHGLPKADDLHMTRATMHLQRCEAF